MDRPITKRFVSEYRVSGTKLISPRTRWILRLSMRIFLRFALSLSHGMAIASTDDIKEKLYGRYRPTNIPDTGADASEERLRLGSDCEGKRWSPRRSRNDSAHRATRTTLEKLDTAGHDACSRHSDHHYCDVRDSILGARQKEIDEAAW